MQNTTYTPFPILIHYNLFVNILGNNTSYCTSSFHTMQVQYHSTFSLTTKCNHCIHCIPLNNIMKRHMPANNCISHLSTYQNYCTSLYLFISHYTHLHTSLYLFIHLHTSSHLFIPLHIQYLSLPKPFYISPRFNKKWLRNLLTDDIK